MLFLYWGVPDWVLAEGPDLQEFMDWRWCTKAEVEKLADKKRLPAYTRVLSEV